MRVISRASGGMSQRKVQSITYRLFFLDEFALVGRPSCRSSSPLMTEYTAMASSFKSKSRALYRPLRMPPTARGGL